MNKMLVQAKDLILGLNFHPDDQHQAYLKDQLIKFGIPSSEFDQAWLTVKKVWASKFNERAFLATKKIGVRLDQIFMAVLVQRIIPSEYAFVIHTTNPTNASDDEVYVESCLGLGEALVADMPG
jgi:alpha-glucan,water dikinase